MLTAPTRFKTMGCILSRSSKDRRLFELADFSVNRKGGDFHKFSFFPEAHTTPAVRSRLWGGGSKRGLQKEEGNKQKSFPLFPLREVSARSGSLLWIKGHNWMHVSFRDCYLAHCFMYLTLKEVNKSEKVVWITLGDFMLALGWAKGKNEWSN